MSDTPAPKPIVKRRPPPPPLAAPQESHEADLVLPAQPRGFRTKAEPWMATALGAAMEEGASIKMAAGLVRVSKVTLMKWIEQGSAPTCRDPVLQAIAAAVEEGRSKASMKGLKNLQMHAMKDWKAQYAILQAFDPDTWVPTQKQKLEVSRGADMEDLSDLTDEELAEKEAFEERVKARKALPA